MGGELTDEAAACLYAGLVTDTGRFQYEATTPETLRLAATLREHPFDHARLVAGALRGQPGAVPRAWWASRSDGCEHERDADLVWTYLTQSDLREAGVHPARPTT